MNQTYDKISASELEIMRILWGEGKAMTINEIIEKMQERSSWEDSTIRTLIRRLHQKGALIQEKRGVFYYSPGISEKEYSRFTTRTLVDKLYHGSPKALIAALVSDEEFSEEELQELRDLLKGDK